METVETKKSGRANNCNEGTCNCEIESTRAGFCAQRDPSAKTQNSGESSPRQSSIVEVPSTEYSINATDDFSVTRFDPLTQAPVDTSQDPLEKPDSGSSSQDDKVRIQANNSYGKDEGKLIDIISVTNSLKSHEPTIKIPSDFDSTSASCSSVENHHDERYGADKKGYMLKQAHITHNEGKSLEERRKQNIEKNHKLWKRLHQELPVPTNPRHDHKKSNKRKRLAQNLDRKRGMRITISDEKNPSMQHEAKWSYSISVNETNKKFPHRSSQIHILHALFHSFLHNFNRNYFCAPPVTFITGPPSTGKTSITIEITKHLSKQSSQRFGWAYINCATVGSGNDNETLARDALVDLLENALNQMNQSLHEPNNQNFTTYNLDDFEHDSFNRESSCQGHGQGFAKTRKPLDPKDNFFTDSLEIQKKGQNPQSCTSLSINDIRKSTNYGALALAFGRHVSSLIKRKKSPCVLILDRAERMLSLTSKQSHHNQFLNQILLLPESMGLNLWVLSISTRCLLTSTRVNNSQGSTQDCIQPLRVHFGAYKGVEVYKKIMNTPSMKFATIGKQPNAPIIDYLYDAMLDSLIFSLQDTTRDLGEIQRLALLLWPQYIKPLEMNWTSYVDREISTKDLKCTLDRVARPWIQKLITICLFQRANSFTCQNKSLPSNMKQWTESFQKQKVTPVSNSPTDKNTNYLKSLPLIPRFILIAGYLCQHNQSDSDLTLFTNKAKGRRNKVRRLSGSFSNGGEGVSTLLSATNLNPFRANTSFPLERMLSVFTSIFGQYSNVSSNANFSVDKECFFNGKKAAEMQGSALFFSSVSLLSNLGLLRPMEPNFTHGSKENGSGKSSEFQVGFKMKSKRLHDAKLPRKLSNIENSVSGGTLGLGTIDLSPKYHCTLSKENALIISSDLGFPLSDYLIQK